MPKASEIVNDLNEMITKYGDLDVVVTRDAKKQMYFIQSTGVLLNADKNTLDMITLQVK